MVAPINKGMLLGQRFEVIEPLGQGGMATVFRAQDLELDRHVAIKVLAPAMASNDVLRRRFLREAENAAVMSHPNIVKVYGAHIHDGSPFIVMEFVDGLTLRDRMKSTFPLKEGLGVLGPVALALSYAHDLGLVHRDLKPENVFCTTRSVPMVGDWGLSRSQNDGTGLTRTGVLLGTPRYMAPEQIISGGGRAQSDLYSLGVMLFELAAGQTPFPGPDVPTVLRDHLDKAPPNLFTVAPGTPPALVELVRQLLSKEAKDRPATAREVAERIRQIGGEVADDVMRPLRASAAVISVTQEGSDTLARTAGGDKSVSEHATLTRRPKKAERKARPLQKTQKRNVAVVKIEERIPRYFWVLWVSTILLAVAVTHFLSGTAPTVRVVKKTPIKMASRPVVSTKPPKVRSVDEILEHLNGIEEKPFIRTLKAIDAVRAKLQKRRHLFEGKDPNLANPVYEYCRQEAQRDLSALYLERLGVTPDDMKRLASQLPKRLKGRTLGTAAAREILRLRYLETQLADPKGPQPPWGYVSRQLGIVNERLMGARPISRKWSVLTKKSLIIRDGKGRYCWSWLAEEAMIAGYVSGLSVVANPMDVLLQRLKDDRGVYDLLGRNERLPTPKDFVSQKKLILTIDGDYKLPLQEVAIVIEAKLFSRDHEIICTLNDVVFRLLNCGRIGNPKWYGSRMRPLRLIAPISPRLVKKGKNELHLLCRRVPGLSDPGAMALASVALIAKVN